MRRTCISDGRTIHTTLVCHYPTGIDCRLFCRLFQFTVQNYSKNSYIVTLSHKSVNPNLWRQFAEALYGSCEKLSCRNADGTLSVVHVRYTAEKRMISGFHRCMVQGCSLKGNALLSQSGNASGTGIQHDSEGRLEESVLSSLQALPVD